MNWDSKTAPYQLNRSSQTFSPHPQTRHYRDNSNEREAPLFLNTENDSSSSPISLLLSPRFWALSISHALSPSLSENLSSRNTLEAGIKHSSSQRGGGGDREGSKQLFAHHTSPRLEAARILENNNIKNIYAKTWEISGWNSAKPFPLLAHNKPRLRPRVSLLKTLPFQILRQTAH